MSLSREAQVAIETRAKAVESVQALLGSGHGRVEAVVDALIAELETSDALLVPLLSGEARAPGAAHVAVNVAILALAVGITLRYPHAQLSELGRLALFEALGRPPADAHGHARRATAAAHAHIVALSTAYDRLSRQQPSGPREWPPAAVKEMLRRERSQVPSAILKATIEMLVSFPLSGLVRLNSGEVGCVVKKNPRLPLRPVVAVAGRPGPPRVPSKIIDLAEQPFLYVREFLGYHRADHVDDGAPA